jgi:hypothetical protein
MCLLLEVFGKFGGATVFVPGGLVLSVTGGELSPCLSDIRLVAVRASEFVYSGVRVFVVGIVFFG